MLTFHFQFPNVHPSYRTDTRSIKSLKIHIYGNMKRDISTYRENKFETISNNRQNNEWGFHFLLIQRFDWKSKNNIRMSHSLFFLKIADSRICIC